MNDDIVYFAIWQIVSFFRCVCRLQITKVLWKHVYLKCIITILQVLKALKREKNIDHYLYLCLIMTVVKTKASTSIRVVSHAFTQPDTHMHSCYCMNDSCSVTTPAPWKSCMTMLSTDEKKIPQKIYECLASAGENELHFVLKNCVTFNEKGKNKYNAENLDSLKLSVTTEDCRAWWMGKEGKRNGNRQRGINYSYFLCVCVFGGCNCTLKLLWNLGNCCFSGTGFHFSATEFGLQGYNWMH